MSRAPWVLPKPAARLPGAATRRCTRRRSAGGWSTRDAGASGRSRSARAPSILADQLRHQPRGTRTRSPLRSHQQAAAAWDDGVYDDEVVPVAGHRPRPRRVHPRRHRRSRRWPSSSPSSAPTARSPPATPRRSTTAPPRCCSATRPAPRGARPRRRWPGSSRAASPASTRRCSASARSRRPTRRSPAPASAGRDLDVVELNEAFAAQSLACLADWPDLDPDDRQPATAAPSRSATRSARSGRAHRSAPSPTSCTAAAAATAWPRSASASARASPSSSRHDATAPENERRSSAAGATGAADERSTRRSTSPATADGAARTRAAAGRRCRSGSPR